MKRKMLALVMAFVLLMLQVPVSANVSSEDPFPADVIQSEAIELVNIALDQGVVPGQDSSEITSLYLSDSIPIYELLADNTFTEADNIKYYGIFGYFLKCVIIIIIHCFSSYTISKNVL